MTSRLLEYFQEVVVCDSEFRPLGNGLQEPRCVCAVELRSQREHRLWDPAAVPCPYPTDSDTVFIAHYAAAELLTHVSLHWPVPLYVLDSGVEFKAAICGRVKTRVGLLDCLKYLNLPYLERERKEYFRDLALEDRRNCEYSVQERDALIDYCMSDVQGVLALLPFLEDHLCPS